MVYILFIYFKQALDKLRIKIIKALEKVKYKGNKLIIRLITMTMEEYKAIIIIGQSVTDSIETNRGIQGDGLSIILFITFLNLATVTKKVIQDLEKALQTTEKKQRGFETDEN